MSFFIIFTTLLFLIYFYTGRRLIPVFTAGRKSAAAVWFMVLLVFLTLPLHFYLRISARFPDASGYLAWIGYCGLGLVFFLFCLVIVRDLCLGTGWTLSKIRAKMQPGKKNALPRGKNIQQERRKTLIRLTGYGAALIGGGAAGIGLLKALQPPKVVRMDLPVPDAHQDLRGLKILQFTDLHVGPTIGRDFVEKTCDLIQKENADIIVFTGDLADGSPQALERDIAPLRKLHAPLGKYFITGNHEYYSGADRWVRAAAGLGFDPLLNEHRVIRRKESALTLAGVTDIRAGKFFASHRSDPAKAFKDCPKDSFKLLLAHQPTSIYEASAAGADLQLSGHTHGGQIFPFNYFILLEHPFIKGMYQHGSTRLYVSQGTGYWGPPMRLGTVPEITVFKFI